MTDRFSASRTGTLTRLLEHLVPLLALTAVLVGAMAYPLRLHEEILGPLEASRGWVGWLYHHELRPFLAYTLSPLIFKESLANVVLLTMTCCWLFLRVLRLQSGTADVRTGGWRERLRAGAVRPEPWIVALILYAAASSLPPDVPGLQWLFRSPTPVWSLKTLLPMALALFLALVLLQPARPRAVTGKFMGAICLAGGVIAAISILQHMEVKGRWWFMAPWENEPRNRMGSLIGHNTGLSSWLLFPFSFGIFYLLTARRVATRVATSVLVLMIGFVLVAAQSRAVWALLVAGLPVYLIFQLRALRLRPPLWMWLAGVAAALAIVASQMVAPEKNPLARHDVTLTQRLTTDVFNLDQLLRETRLRVVRASRPLVAERPLLGHGLGAFQWVYPPAQGRYFSEGLGTVTGFTVRRTNVAHTDYVQLLVELGLVGLILAGVPLALMIRMALRARRAAPAREKARLHALLFPVAAVALHAWIDFPMHIEPIALATVAALTLAAGAGRWPALAPCPQEGASALPDASPSPAPVEGPRWRAFRPGHVVALSVAGFSFILAACATVFLVRNYVSDIHYVDGSNWINTTRVLPESESRTRYNYLTLARKHLRKATHLDPSNGEAYEKMAYASGLLGELLLRLADEAAREGNADRAAELREQARLQYEAAVQACIHQISHGELRWHYTWYLLGQSYRALWKLNPDPSDLRQLNYLRSARANLERAVEYNIADPVSLNELADALEEKPEENPARALRLRSLIPRVAPEYAAEHLYGPVIKAAMRGHWAEAWRRLERAEATIQGDEWLTLIRGQILLYSALWPPPELDTEPPTSATLEYRRERLRGMEAVLARLSKRPGNVPQAEIESLRMHHAAASGDYEAALAAADRLIRLRPQDGSVQILRWMLATRLGQTREVGRDYKGTAEGEKFRHRYRMLYFGEMGMGAGQLSNLVPSGTIQLELFEGLRAAAFLKTLGQWDRVLIIARHLNEHYPGDPAVATLLEEAQAKTGSGEN